MAIYHERDLAISDDGDLEVNARGDLEVSESTDSVRQLLKMIIATDIGELDMSPVFGANLGSLIGHNLHEVMNRIPVMIRDGIRRSSYLDPGDVFVDVYPIDVDKLMLFVDIKGSYVNSSAQMVLQPSGTLKFYFPYSAERIREWV